MTTQVEAIYAAELPLFQPNAKCLLAGSANVQALAYDADTDEIAAATAVGTNLFKGLQRVGYQQSTTGANLVPQFLKDWYVNYGTFQNGVFVPNSGYTGAWLGNSPNEFKTTAGSTYTVQFELQADGFNYALVSGDGQTSRLAAVSVFDLVNGAVVSSPLGSATIEKTSDGWWLCAITGVANSSAAWPFVRPYVTGAAEATGDGVKGIKIRNAMFSAGTGAKAYVDPLSNKDNHKAVAFSDGNLVIGTAGGVDAFLPSIPLREKLTKRLPLSAYDPTRGSLQAVTTSATPLSAYFALIPEGKSYQFKLNLACAQYGGSFGQAAKFEIKGIAYRPIGGNATVQTEALIVSYRSSATISASIAADTTNQALYAALTGLSGVTLQWSVDVLEWLDLGLDAAA